MIQLLFFLLLTSQLCPQIYIYAYEQKIIPVWRRIHVDGLVQVCSNPIANAL